MKHKVRLPSSVKNILIKIPETSMGAQRLDICLSDGKIISDVSIFNGEDAMLEEPIITSEIVAFRERNGKIWKVR